MHHAANFHVMFGILYPAQNAYIKIIQVVNIEVLSRFVMYYFFRGGEWVPMTLKPLRLVKTHLRGTVYGGE